MRDRVVDKLGLEAMKTTSTNANTKTVDELIDNMGVICHFLSQSDQWMLDEMSREILDYLMFIREGYNKQCVT